MKNNFSIQVTEDNTGAFLADLAGKSEKILTKWGMKLETYAKKNCPVGTPETTGKPGYIGGTLRDSITHEVIKDSFGLKFVVIGSNVHYAPFVELGTMSNFEPPEEWEQFTSKKGSKKGKGIEAKHFIRDAVKDHVDELKQIFDDEMKA